MCPVEENKFEDECSCGSYLIWCIIYKSNPNDIIFMNMSE